MWGHRVADFAFAMARCRDRLLRAREAVAVGKLSGPVGTYSNIDPAIEAEVMAELGLRPADVSTQVVLRDGISEWVSVLALISTVCEAIALEVRHGQQTEVARAGRAVRPGPEGLVGHAAQEEPGPVRADLRPGPGGPRAGRAGDGGDPAVARAGHLALVHRAGGAARRGHRHRLPAGRDHGADHGPVGRRGTDAGEPGRDPRPDLHLGGAARAGRGRDVPRGRVRAGPGRGHGHAARPGRRSGRRCASTPAERGQPLDEARLDEACRPERYVQRLGRVFERLERLA